MIIFEVKDDQKGGFVIQKTNDKQLKNIMRLIDKANKELEELECS